MLRHSQRVLAIVVLLAAQIARGQDASQLDLGGGVVANGEAERYLRVLQLLGQVPAYPVGIRPWNAREALTAIVPTGAHPWQNRFATCNSACARTVQWLRPNATMTWNSTASEGEGIGWLGRGLNVTAVGGVRTRLKIVDIQVAPWVSWSQNQGFTLAPNGLSGDGAVRDARFPGNIDAPQRFGTGAYGRVDAGYSRIAVNTRWVTTGLSTEPLAWGPARDEPLVMGPNGGGYPHLFIGTGSPLPIGIGTVHVRVLAGRLEQSRWSPVMSGNRSRFASAVVGGFQPRGVRGLEVGLIRFEHRVWRPGIATVANALRPFTGILSDPAHLINSDEENGYASAYFRWAVAPAGFELYGEYGREDYAGNSRWLLQKPDDLGNLLLGVQRAWRTSGGKVRVARAELVNAELSSNERGQRGFTYPIPPYTHGGVLQGHTVNGRYLGSVSAYGGAGWHAATDWYGTDGRRTIALERHLVRDWLPVAVPTEGRSPEVRYTARMERVRFVAKGREIGWSAALSYTFNQNTVPGHDTVNLQGGFTWRGW